MAWLIVLAPFCTVINSSNRPTIPLAARVMAPSPIERLCPRRLDTPDKKKPYRKYNPVMVNAVNEKCVREHRGYSW
jgi:hypothetical protein